MLPLLAAALIALLAMLVRGVTGFGAALVMSPLLLLFFDVHTAVVASAAVQIVTGFGIAWHARLAIDRAKPSILLKHEPSNLPVAQEAGINLMVSGHTHQGQLWPMEYVARWSYKGFAYGLKKLGEMQVFVSSGTGTWGPPMRVGTYGEIVVFIFE